MSDLEPVVLGTLTISLEIQPDGRTTVWTDSNGELQYITALGMLEMAKDSLLELFMPDDED